MGSDWSADFSPAQLRELAEADEAIDAKPNRDTDFCLIERPLIVCPKCRASMPLGKRFPKDAAPMRQTKRAVPYGEQSERARYRCRCGNSFPVIFETSDF